MVALYISTSPKRDVKIAVPNKNRSAFLRYVVIPIHICLSITSLLVIIVSLLDASVKGYMQDAIKHNRKEIYVFIGSNRGQYIQKYINIGTNIEKHTEDKLFHRKKESKLCKIHKIVCFIALTR